MVTADAGDCDCSDIRVCWALKEVRVTSVIRTIRMFWALSVLTLFSACRACRLVRVCLITWEP